MTRRVDANYFRNVLMAGVALVVMSVVPAAQAAFVAVDSFDSYTQGSNINGQGGWSTGRQNNFSAVVAADPENVANSVLQTSNTGGTGRVFNDFQASRSGLNIATGTSATIFGRFRSTAAGVDIAFGASDLDQAALLADAESGGRFNNFEAYGRVVSSGTQFQVRNGGGFTDGANSLTITPDTWYNVWLLVDNTAATYQAYTQGPSDAAPVQYLGGTVTGDFAFRSTANPHGNLISYLLDSNATSGNTYFDDIYVDTAGHNLANPVPEPSSLALLFCCSLVLWVLKR
jgi:hypothetical protein